MIRGEPAIGRDQSREPCLYSVEPYGVPTMKQSYASAGKAPRRRVHSLSGIAAIAGCGLPPPRIVNGYSAHQAQSGAEPCLSFLVLESVAHSAGRSSTPSGTSPVVTRRHSAISSLRASATIIVVLRAPLGPSVRVRYQRASALSFWNTRKRHANWISPRRTRALPPPRIVIGYPAHQAQSGAEPCLSFLDLESAAHSAGRSLTPSGTSPVVTRRHSAISSLRASATIIVVLRAPLGPSVRVRYQRASALSFWNTRKRHANWISPRRTRALPALARPFSRRFKPLSSGDPVSPA